MKTRFAATVLALAAACASGKDSVDLTKPITGAAASDAAKAYEKGMLEMKDKNYPEATRYFEAVRSNFPYSQYAALSELAVADMNFDRDEFATAATAYQDFVKSHPSHPRADYASFRAGLANYRDKPSDWFLLPPADEKDQTSIRTAVDTLQRFVLAYPKSEFVPRARDLINECRERLAQHDRYVAGFYWKRKAWKGAAGRLLRLADVYGDLDNGKLRSDSLWRAAVAYQNAHDDKAQREMLHRLATEALPGDPHRTWAEEMLKSLPPEPAQKAEPAAASSAEKAEPAPENSSPAASPATEKPSPAEEKPSPGSPVEQPDPTARPTQEKSEPTEPRQSPENPGK